MRQGFVIVADVMIAFLEDVRSCIAQKVHSHASGNWKQYIGVYEYKKKRSEAKDVYPVPVHI